jgi:hypothetical protein
MDKKPTRKNVNKCTCKNAGSCQWCKEWQELEDRIRRDGPIGGPGSI